MTPKNFKRPPLRQRRRHIIRQMFNGWPWLIWLAAAIMVLVLLPGGLHRIRFLGEAERIYEYISPLKDGRLKTLQVNMGDIVKAGQLIGELDNEALTADLLMNQASLMKSRDKLHQIRYDVENLKLEQAKAQAKLKTLESSWARTQELQAKHLILEQDIEDLQPQIEATKDILTHYPALISQLNDRLTDAERDAQNLDSDELAELVAAQSRLTTAKAGIVEEVLHQPGDIVETGDPIVRISNVSTRRVIAFMPEAKRVELAEGEACRVITETNRKIFHGTVLSITAAIRKLPVNTGLSDQLLRGRRIVIEIDDGELLPGEQVVVVPDMSFFEQWFGKNNEKI